MGFSTSFGRVLLKRTSELLLVVLKGASEYKKCHRFKPMTKVYYKSFSQKQMTHCCNC